MSLIATKKDRLYTAIGGFVVVAAVAFGFVLVTGGGTRHTVYAQFSNAQFLVPGNTVHISGVTAGKVVDLKVNSAENVAIVKLSIAKSDWPLHTDATAMVRPVTVLGEQYVDINAGSPSKPAIPDGGTIPLSQSGSSTNLQSVLNAVNDPTATALGVMLTSLGQGLSGQGQNSADAIRALSPALTNTTGLLKLLDGQNQLLTEMIDNVTPVIHALNNNQGQTLDKLLTTSNQLLGATAASSNNMGTDIQQLPGSLAAVRSSFTQLGNLADQGTPALQSLTPLTDNLQTVSQELLNFSAAANPAAASLQPLLAQTRSLIDKAIPVVATLKAAGPTGLSDLKAGQPILHANVADLNNFFSFISEWASTTGNYDGTSHFFRFHAQGDCALLFIASSACPLSGAAAKPATAKSAVVTPRAAQTTPASPASPSNLLVAPSQAVSNLLNGLLGAASSSPPPPPAGSATGLTPSQEQNLVGYLLGGL